MARAPLKEMVSRSCARRLLNSRCRDSELWILPTHITPRMPHHEREMPRVAIFRENFGARNAVAASNLVDKSLSLDHSRLLADCSDQGAKGTPNDFSPKAYFLQAALSI